MCVFMYWDLKLCYRWNHSNGRCMNKLIEREAFVDYFQFLFFCDLEVFSSTETPRSCSRRARVVLTQVDTVSHCYTCNCCGTQVRS